MTNSPNQLPEIPGMIWLRFAIPVPETIKDDWAHMDALTRGQLAHEIRQAAEGTLYGMVGAPLPVLGDTS